LSYDPKSQPPRRREPTPTSRRALARFPVELMGAAARAKLLELKPTWIVPPVLLGCVISLAARRALERHRRPIGFRLLRHCTTSSRSGLRPTTLPISSQGRRPVDRASPATPPQCTSLPRPRRGRYPSLTVRWW